MEQVDLTVFRDMTPDIRFQTGAALMLSALAIQRSHGVDMVSSDGHGKIYGVSFAYLGPHALELQQIFLDFMREKHDSAVRDVRPTAQFHMGGRPDGTEKPEPPESEPGQG